MISVYIYFYENLILYNVVYLFLILNPLRFQSNFCAPFSANYTIIILLLSNYFQFSENQSLISDYCIVTQFLIV
jgi:hypothetical protein